MESIKEGDNVWLKGQIASPKMTVDSIDASGYAVCIWFDLEMKPNKQVYKVSSLTKEKPTN